MKLISLNLLKLRKAITGEYKPIVSNFISLGIIQGSNFLLPLLTFPYIVRTVGVEHFGIIALLQTIMSYFVIFTDYGFSMSATKDVSVNRADKKILTSIYSEVIVTKLLLCALSFGILMLGLIIFPRFQPYWLLVLYSFFIVLGQVLQPNWFFQGIEQMKFLTYISLLSKALYAIGIFTFIKNPTDFIYVNLILGVSSTIGGIISMVLVYRFFRIGLVLPTILKIKNQFRNGWNIFISSVTITVANNTNILILSLVASPLILGYYSIAEKVFLLFRTFTAILYQIIYPRVCMLAQKSFLHLASFLKNIVKFILISFLPLSLLLFFLADEIVYFLVGNYVTETAYILRILSFGPLIAAFNIPVAQTMLAYHLNKTFAVVLSFGAFVNVACNFILSYYFMAIGTAYSVLITETVITVLLYVVIYKYYPQYTYFINPEKRAELSGVVI